jgi:NTP pyrophosphatase (non-canonical NTP hydrolase)
MINQKDSSAVASGEYLMKKAEEIAKRIKAPENSDAASNKEALANLLSELLFAAFVMSEQQGVDLEESFLQSVNEVILVFVT